MSKFEGTWIDGNGDTISISGNWDVYSMSYSNGRGPFQAFSHNVTLETSVITGNFSDDGVFTGLLDAKGETIYWNNNTQWRRS